MSILKQIEKSYKMRKGDTEENVIVKRKITVKRVFKKSGALTSADKADLENCGFKIEDDGAHYKILFHDDPGCMFTVSRTPSDHRQGKNLTSDIIKIIDVGKKL